jgi:rare lipoprotein A
MAKSILHYFKIVFIPLVFLLSSCSHVARKDGPPNFYVDETKVKNAVPKVEPLSKCGNMASYRVFGKRYYTLRTSRNYDQIGVASWYGTQFHRHSTSSGEPYNMLAMTAAHKTLPLPTYVEVTNLQNNRTIIVKVNDRGPFEANRLIDLSYVAAKKLGMLGHGTTRVRVKAINPRTADRQMYFAKKSQPVDASTHFVYFQVGTFHNKLRAQKLKHRLGNLVHAPISVSRSRSGASIYRVQIGPIKDLATEYRITHRLRNLGIKSNKIYGV